MERRRLINEQMVSARTSSMSNDRIGQVHCAWLSIHLFNEHRVGLSEIRSTYALIVNFVYGAGVKHQQRFVTREGTGKYREISLLSFSQRMPFE